MKLTRPQRVNVAIICFVVGSSAFIWMIWSQRLLSWTANTAPVGGGTLVREFGLLRYLTITAQCSGPFGAPGRQGVISSAWDWNPTNLFVNIMITLTGLGILAWWFRRNIVKETLVGSCDECGYDLRSLNSEVCPECGARLNRLPASGA